MSWKPPYRSLNPDGAITKVAPGPRLVSVQYLRAVAAMMVVVHHAVNQLAPAQPRPTFLEAGVDMFFVISGLVIWLKVAERPENAGKFMLDRLFRIAPLYWLLTTAVLGAVSYTHLTLPTNREV